MNASEAMSNMREMGADEDLMLAFAYLANHLSEFRTADGFLLKGLIYMTPLETE